MLAILNVWSVDAAKQVEAEAGAGGERKLVDYIMTDIISNPVASEASSGDIKIPPSARDILHRSHDIMN